MNNSSDLIRPDNGEVGNNAHSEDVGSLQGQVENAEVKDAAKDEECRAEAEEEVRIPKPAARPYTPTRAEINEHEVTHLPYRSWC